MKSWFYYSFFSGFSESISRRILWITLILRALWVLQTTFLNSIYYGSKLLGIINYGTFNSFLAGLGGIKLDSASYSDQKTHKPVQTSSAKQKTGVKISLSYNIYNMPGAEQSSLLRQKV